MIPFVKIFCCKFVVGHPLVIRHSAGICTKYYIKTKIENTSSVCGETIFKITVRNDENIDWNNVDITIQMPCGFEYISNSLTGAQEKNVTLKQQPVFQLAISHKKRKKNLFTKLYRLVRLWSV